MQTVWQEGRSIEVSRRVFSERSRFRPVLFSARGTSSPGPRDIQYLRRRDRRRKVCVRLQRALRRSGPGLHPSPYSVLADTANSIGLTSSFTTRSETGVSNYEPAAGMRKHRPPATWCRVDAGRVADRDENPIRKYAKTVKRRRNVKGPAMERGDKNDSGTTTIFATAVDSNYVGSATFRDCAR